MEILNHASSTLIIFHDFNFRGLAVLSQNSRNINASKISRYTVVYPASYMTYAEYVRTYRVSCIIDKWLHACLYTPLPALSTFLAIIIALIWLMLCKGFSLANISHYGSRCSTLTSTDNTRLKVSSGCSTISSFITSTMKHVSRLLLLTVPTIRSENDK